MLRHHRWAYVEANDVQLPDEYDQIVSALSDWIAIAASTRGLTGACPDRTNHPLRLLPSILQLSTIRHLLPTRTRFAPQYKDLDPFYALPPRTIQALVTEADLPRRHVHGLLSRRIGPPQIRR